MKGDFTRLPVDTAKHFSRVLLQQGRVLLDSDWNEQADIFLYYLRALAADLIGPHGGPAQNCGFAVIAGNVQQRVPGPPGKLEEAQGAPLRQINLQRNFVIGRGRYYVEGLLCENDTNHLYARAGATELAQPDWPAEELENGKSYLVYLDAWERHVTALDDESIREVALGAHGPDTATRARVVWQVKTLELRDELVIFNTLNCNTIKNSEPWRALVDRLQPVANPARLRAKADEPDDAATANPCIVSPDARYRRAENQLYRVEIHRGGDVNTPATFKMSRENGSTLLSVRNVSGRQVTLDHMGRDARSGLQVGDWVELVDEDYELRNDAEELFQVTEIDPADMVVTLSGTPPPTRTDRAGRSTPRRNPLLRRWDHKAGDPRVGGLELRDGAAVIKEATGNENQNWLMLEDGIQIQFQSGGLYRTGDYWLIPAREATGDVEWPGEVGRPLPLPPHGVRHYYAPLATITVQGNGEVTVNADFRNRFNPLAECPAV